MNGNDLIEAYIDYTSEGEVPVVFNRWSMICGIAALLERNLYYPFGFGNIYPNMYAMLLGASGTRKSTTIKLVKKLLQQAGYDTFAGDRTSKEKFIMDLAAKNKAEAGSEDILSQNLFGDLAPEVDVTPCFVVADEANDFFGQNNIEFLSILGSLWDLDGKYENRTKSSDVDVVWNPTITILSGNTPSNFATAFPPTIFGQGFFSRILLIHGEPNGKRVPRPRPPSADATAHIIELLRACKQNCTGELKLTATAETLLDAIYLNYKPPQDPRFDSYANRRQTHLLKLVMACSASLGTPFANEDTVMRANTILAYTESLMPKALGGFGAAKDAEVMHKVLTLIQHAGRPVKPDELWKHVHRDITRPSELADVIQKLTKASQIQIVPGAGFLPIREQVEQDKSNMFVDYARFLSEEEVSVKL